MHHTNLIENGLPVASLITIFGVEAGTIVRTHDNGAYLIKSIAPVRVPRHQNPWNRDCYEAVVTAANPDELDPLPKKEFPPLPSGHWKLQAAYQRSLRSGSTVTPTAEIGSRIYNAYLRSLRG